MDMQAIRLVMQKQTVRLEATKNVKTDIVQSHFGNKHLLTLF